MASDWLHHIAPYPRPSQAASPEDSSYTGRGFHGPGWLEPRRVIYEHQLVLIRDGTFLTEIEGEKFSCEAGSFLIVPPGKWEATWNVGQSRGARWWCHFDWVYQGPWGQTPIMTYHPAQPRAAFLRRAPAFVGRQIRHGRIPSPELAYDLFERLYRKQNSGDAREQLASRAVLLELLLSLLNPGAVQAPRERSVRLAEMVRQQLKGAVEAGEGPVSIQALLEKSHYSYAHLCRLFRAEYGVSPVKYLHSLRIDSAKLLLRDTSLDIAEIAARVGLPDAVYFARLFRKVAGRSPSEYRRDIG